MNANVLAELKATTGYRTLRIEAAGNGDPTIAIFRGEPTAPNLEAYFGLSVLTPAKRRELAKAILGDLPLEVPAPELPTEPGVYVASSCVDLDAPVLYTLSALGQWTVRWPHFQGPERRTPEEMLRGIRPDSLIRLTPKENA